MTEIRIPTEYQVRQRAVDKGGPHDMSLCTQTYKAMRDLLREAIAAAEDDPSKSLVGEIRQDPGSPERRAQRVLVENSDNRPWLIVRGDGRGYQFNDNKYVQGWKVVGAVPGTPAADIVTAEIVR